jgi:hypothetical protein
MLVVVSRGDGSMAAIAVLPTSNTNHTAKLLKKIFWDSFVMSKFVLAFVAVVVVVDAAAWGGIVHLYLKLSRL